MGSGRHILWTTLALGLLGCEPAPTISAPLKASAPDCAARCVEPSGPTPDDIPCVRDACAPAGAAQSAGVSWRGLSPQEDDPSIQQGELSTGQQPETVPVARFMIRAVETDALYASLVDAWFRCQTRVFHRAEPPEDWQIRFYAAERDLLAKWSWLDHRVVFFGVAEAGADDEGRAVWTLPGGLSEDDPGYISPSDAEAMVHDLIAVDVCGG